MKLILLGSPYRMYTMLTWVLTTIVITSSLIQQVVGQETSTLIDPATGFKLHAQIVKHDPPLTKGELALGVAFPKNLDKDEYIGYLTAARPKSAGWTGISHSSGMTESLLLVTWAEGQNVQTSFRYAKGYTAPVKYTGQGTTLTQLAHKVNTTHYSLTYKCQKCFTWDQNGVKGNQSLQGEVVLFGWAQASAAPSQPKSATSPIRFHDLGFGILPFEPKLGANADYDKYASTPPKGAAGALASSNSTIPPKGHVRRSLPR